MAGFRGEMGAPENCHSGFPKTIGSAENPWQEMPPNLHRVRGEIVGLGDMSIAMIGRWGCGSCGRGVSNNHMGPCPRCGGRIMRIMPVEAAVEIEPVSVVRTGTRASYALYRGRGEGQQSAGGTRS